MLRIHVKYQLLIKTCEGVGLKNYNDSKPSIEYSTDMDDTYGNTEDCNANKERKMLIIFDDMIANMLRIIKLIISLDFITKSYFAVPKNIRQNSTYYFIIKIPKKRGLQQISKNYSPDIDFKGFVNLYKQMYCKVILFFSQQNPR